MIRLIAGASAALLAAASAAIAGLLGFLGLVVPHVVRMAGGTASHGFVVPVSALGGAALLVAGDTLARTAKPPLELPVGPFMVVIGVPMFGNRTPYSPLEQLFTEKVRVEFQSHGRYQVLPADTGVDAVVRGDITNVSASPVGFNQSQQASRYRFTVLRARSKRKKPAARYRIAVLARDGGAHVPGRSRVVRVASVKKRG